MEKDDFALNIDISHPFLCSANRWISGVLGHQTSELSQTLNLKKRHRVDTLWEPVNCQNRKATVELTKVSVQMPKLIWDSTDCRGNMKKTMLNHLRVVQPGGFKVSGSQRWRSLTMPETRVRGAASAAPSQYGPMAAVMVSRYPCKKKGYFVLQNNWGRGPTNTCMYIYIYMYILCLYSHLENKYLYT